MEQTQPLLSRDEAIAALQQNADLILDRDSYITDPDAARHLADLQNEGRGRAAELGIGHMADVYIEFKSKALPGQRPEDVKSQRGTVAEALGQCTYLAAFDSEELTAMFDKRRAEPAEPNFYPSTRQTSSPTSGM